MRTKPSDPKTWEEFLEIDKRDFGEADLKGQQVCKCMEMADFYIFNNSSIKILLKRIEELYSEILKKQENFQL